MGMKIFLALCILALSVPAIGSTLDGYDRAKLADENYRLANGDSPLEAGATNEEVIGVITTMNPYIGFPRTLNALRIANEVFDSRK